MEASPTVVWLDVPHGRRPSANLEGTLGAEQTSPVRVVRLGQRVSCVSLVALNMHCETFKRGGRFAQAVFCAAGSAGDWD